jgi:hypothetical protein
MMAESTEREEAMIRLLLFALGISLLSGRDAAAQERLPLAPGDRVRVAGPVHSGTYTVLAVEADDIVVRDNSDAAELRIATASLESLDLRRRRSRGQGAWRGAAIGLVAGAGIGVFAGIADGDDTNCIICWSKEEKAVMGAITLGGTGALAGALIGRAAPGGYWQRVSLPARVGVRPLGGGRAALAFSMNW